MDLLAAEVHFDGLEVLVLRQQQQFVPRQPAEPLDGHFVLDARHHDVATAHGLGLVDRQEVAVQDADVLHAVAVDAQQEVGLRPEHARRHVQGVFDVLHGEDRIASGDAPDDGQAGVAHQADAPGGAGDDLDVALPAQRLQVLLGRVRRLEVQRLGDVRAGGRIARLRDVVLDDAEHLGLATGEFVHRDAVHVSKSVCDYIQQRMDVKGCFCALCWRGAVVRLG